ncbi:hypothetical protein [Bradyrhizobium genosp. P]
MRFLSCGLTKINELEKARKLTKVRLGEGISTHVFHYPSQVKALAGGE